MIGKGLIRIGSQKLSKKNKNKEIHKKPFSLKNHGPQINNDDFEYHEKMLNSVIIIQRNFKDFMKKKSYANNKKNSNVNKLIFLKIHLIL